MEAQELRTVLTQLESTAKSVDWMGQLDRRKREELEFHNRHRDQAAASQLPSDTYELLYGNKKFYSTTRLSRDYVCNWIRAMAPGKVFLDYACGNGANALLAAQAGSLLSIGLDISDVSLGNARKAAALADVADRCAFVQGDCERTGLPDESVDVVICSGMLHHLDLSYAFPELRRILRRGGRVLAVEALDYNPLIKLYRNLTPGMRTEWEKKHILSMADVKFARRFFEIGEVRYWHLLSIATAYLTRWPALQRRAGWTADQLDRLLLAIPGLRRMAWQFTFELLKPSEE